MAVYDGARHVFLSAIFLAALSWCPQEPPHWFTVSAAAADVPAATVRRIEAEADSGLTELRRVFGALPRQHFQIVVHRDMASLDPAVAAAMHQHTPGVALLGRHEIHLVLDNMQYVESAQSRPVVVHEMVHELLDQYTAPFAAQMPRWLHEGLAQALAGDTYLGGREEDLIWRIGARQLLPFTKLEADFPRDEIGLRLAYAESYSFVAWLIREFGVEDVLASARKVDLGTSYMEALVLVTRRTSQELQDGWEDYLRHGSGARARAMLENCFALSMILALPLLALAMIRRLRADQRARERIERQEQFEREQSERERLLQEQSEMHDVGTDGEAD